MSETTGRGVGLERYWSMGELYWPQPETEDAAPKIGEVSEADTGLAREACRRVH